MMPPTKDQTSINVDNPTIDASDGAELPNGKPNKDMARQEYAKDADINHMLSRFGIVPERGAPTYGEWDDTIDLQSALTATREAAEAYRNLPPELREKFNSMEELLTAVDNGSLVIKDEELPKSAAAAPPQPPPQT